MSIYATLYEFAIRRFGEDEPHHLAAQGVPAHIDYTGQGWEWLPPPVPYSDDLDVPQSMRAVVIVEHGTAKGTARCGQEYADPLLILSGQPGVGADPLHRVDGQN